MLNNICFGTYREDINGIRRQLPALIRAQETQERIMRERVELFKQVEAAAKDYSTASAQTMMGKYKTFEEMRIQLIEVLRVFPKSPERTEDFNRLTELTKEVRNQHEKNLTLRNEMRAEVQKRVEKNRKKVEQVFENGGSLVDALLLAAPKPVQQAIGELLKNKEVMQLLSNNEQLIELLGENVEEGIKQITGNGEGALVVVSPEKQIAVIETILSELSKNEDLTSKEIAVARQFLGTIVAMAKGAQQLQRGEKEYAVFVTEVDGHFKVMSVNLNDILNDPSSIGRIFSSYMEQGVLAPLHMQLASREQAAAIAVIMNNVGVKALTGRMGSLSTEELRSLTQGSMEGALVKGSGGELVGVTEVKTLPQIVALIAHSAGNVDALARVLETTSPELGKQLTQVIGELNRHYANKPSTAYTEEQVFKIFTELLAMQLTAQDIERVLSLPTDNPQRGAIGLFVDSSLFKIDSSGNLLMIMDSSIEEDLLGQRLMLGMVPPTPQLKDSHKIEPVPVILPPKKDTTIVEPPKPIKVNEDQLELDDEIEWGPFVGPGDSEFFDEFDFEDEPKPPKKEKKAIDLSAHKADFNALVNDVTKICEELAEKQEDHGEKYDQIMLEALNLRDLLQEQGKEFFALKHPTVAQLDSFKAVCNDAIDNVMPEFAKHRGAWWDDSGLLGKLLTVCKAVLGVIAAITIIPAVIIEDHTKHGFVHTFFTKPKTDSEVSLGAVKAKVVEQGIELDEAVEEHNKPTM